MIYFPDEGSYILNTPDEIKIASPKFNHYFNKTSGFSVVFGETKEEDPDFSPFGPLIADIEITTKCAGPKGVPCSFCYKANTPNGKNMSLDMFKALLLKLPPTVGQIAFGVDAQCSSNPETWDIMKHCKSKHIVPNVTVADISDETADKIAEYMGACAVSVYDDKDLAYNCIKKLTDRGMDQVNIHFCLYQQSFKRALEVMKDIQTDERLSKLNAIVFLSLKQKGRGIHHSPMIFGDFKKIINFAIENNIRFGLDSCGCSKFLQAVSDSPNFEQYKIVSEPCESTAFSMYADVEGNFYPCSFCEGVDDWKNGISIIDCDNFMKDIWFNERVVNFRNKLISNKRKCPVYII